MQKTKKFSKQLVLLFLALATVITGVLFANPVDVGAASNGYKVRVTVHVTDPDNNMEATNDWSFVKVYTYGSNGTDTSATGEVVLADANTTAEMFKTENEYVYTVTTENNAFPYRAEVRGDMAKADDSDNGDGSGFGFWYEFAIQKADGTSWVSVNAPAKTVSGNGECGGQTVDMNSGDYPIVTSATMGGDNSIKAPYGSGTKSASVSLSNLIDQYNVSWVASAPSFTWSTSQTNGLSISGSSSSATLTAAVSAGTGKTADYTTTITAKNTKGTTVATKAVNVLVPHTVTVDTSDGVTYPGTNPIAGEYYTGGTVALQNPSKTAYDFASWTNTGSIGSVSGNVYTFGNGNGTVKPNWTPHPYKITFADGSTTTNVSYNIESSSITLPTASDITGYTFSHWEVTNADGNWANGNEVTATNITGKYGNITATAKYTANKYTVNFDNGWDTREFTYDSTYGELPTPTKDNYDFTGWFKADDTKLTADQTVDITDTLYVTSHWTPHNYSFNINANGGTVSGNAGTYNIEGGTVPSADIIGRTGYTFSHWEVDSSVGNWVQGDIYNPGNNTLGMYGDVTLKAIWTPNKYTLSFELNVPAGAVTDPVIEITKKEVTFDAAIGELPTPTLDGYTFLGWFKSADSDEAVTSATVHLVATGRTIYARWTPKTQNITIDPNGGTKTDDATYTIEAGAIPDGNLVSRPGYTFSGWIVSVADGNWGVGSVCQPGDSTVGMYGNITLKAQWTANRYTANFELNDENSVSSATINKESMTVVYDSPLNAAEEMPIINRNGYTFLGWFTAIEGGEQVTAETVYTTIGDTTYYAHWQLNTYTLSFNVVGGTSIDSILYTVEDDITLPTPVKNGWDFTNWINFSATSGSWTTNKMYDKDALAIGNGHYGDIELMAMYTVKTYTITWIINGKTETSDHVFNTVPMRDDPVVTDDPEYDYEFIGWSPTIAIVSGPATYTAQFNKTPKVYTVTWVDEDNSVVESRQVAFGTAFPTDVAVPEKTGHTGVWANVPATMPANNITISPAYTPIDYTVQWSVDGVVVETDTVPYGSLPYYNGAEPTKAETDEYTYEFDAWTPSVGVVNGDIVYEAQFTGIPKEYTIKFVADGNTVSTQIIPFGTSITNIPNVPEKFGFAGSWANIPETMPAHDVTIEAVYVQGCVVTWVVDETQYQMAFASGAQIYYDRGTPVRLATAEYSYTFIGWSETPDGEIVTTFPTATQDNRTYYAIFEATPNSYTITWTADGAVVFSETLSYGSDITNIPEIPGKTGHTGVWETYPATMPAENVIINVVYSRISYEVQWDVNGTISKTYVLFGDMPSYSNIDTDKASTATTDFTFIGWDKELTAVTDNVTYVAQYLETARKYTVTWRYDSESGKVIDTYELENGSTNIFIPTIENRTGHDYSYELPSVMPTENITIVVIYTPKQYTITWVTPDGDITETWSYGETPVFMGETPTKAPTPEREYEFTGWTPSVSAVTGNATYTAQFSSTLRKYTVTWMVDGEFHDSRSVDFGTLIPTIPVPEKTGYTGVWETMFRTMPAQDITINVIYTAKKYTVYWKVDGLTIYSASVSFGSPIPPQVVPEKPGNTGIWQNVPDTMPAENITINAFYAPNAYEVSWRVDGVTKTDVATFGQDYLLVFDGSIPEEVRITVSGNSLAPDMFTYNPSTGELKIFGTAITGNIYITARAAGGNFNVIINVDNATLSNENLVVGEKKAYHTQIIPNAGYLVPSEVQIFIDGILKTEGYVYDSITGRLTINAELVVGEVEIVFECPLDPDYDPNNPPVEDDEPDTSNCDCSCHSDSAFVRFFFAITNFLRKIFGMDQYRYCECGAAHW